MFNLLRNRVHFMTTVVKRLNILGNRGHFMTAVVKKQNFLGNRGHFMTAVRQEAESPWKPRSFYDRRCQETVTFYFCITLVCLYFQ